MLAVERKPFIQAELHDMAMKNSAANVTKEEPQTGNTAKIPQKIQLKAGMEYCHTH